MVIHLRPAPITLPTMRQPIFAPTGANSLFCHSTTIHPQIALRSASRRAYPIYLPSLLLFFFPFHSSWLRIRSTFSKNIILSRVFRWCVATPTGAYIAVRVVRLLSGYACRYWMGPLREEGMLLFLKRLSIIG